MNTASANEITLLLQAWRGGDETALDDLLPRVYQELRRIAHRHMRRENPGHLLQTTALVHEAFLRLHDGKPVDWQNRAHFFAVAALVMRRLLIDIGKANKVQFTELEEALELAERRDGDFTALNDALDALARLDARKARVVELRHLVGLSVEETAEVLDTSKETVMRDWKFAQRWLLKELSGKSDADA